MKVFISVFILVFYYLWFVILDRRLIFLYGHMHKTPFDSFTAGRYWMAGLVLSAMVLIAYTIVNLIVKKLYRTYQLPDWKLVWKYSCFIVVLPLFYILSFMGKPPMPLLLSLWILVVLFSGLALALYAGSSIVTNVRQSILAFLDGWALVPMLTLLAPSIEYGLKRPSVQGTFLVVVPAVAIGMGLFWFWIMTVLYKRFKQPSPSLGDTLLWGLTTSYVLLPFLHYLCSRPGFVRYITNSENFLANTFWIQIAAYAAVLGAMWLVGKWRKLNIKDFAKIKKILFFLTLLTIGYVLVTKIVTGKETDIWMCENDTWIKQGNPPYEKPFDEECGIIDKEMGIQ